MSNKTKIIIGLVFIIAAFVCAGAIFYSIGNVYQENTRKVADLETRLVNLINDKARAALPAADARKVERKTLNTEELLARAGAIYGERERTRRDGVLWIDKAANRCIITLGAANGITKGSILSVYREDNLIDKVTVDTPFDIISYVTPLETPLDQFDDNYYRVTKNVNSE